MAKNENGSGRDTTFKPEYIEQAAKLAKLGATDFEIAEFFKVSDRTLRNWKHEHAGFRDSLQLGKDEADNRVERALYQRAVGYSHDSVKVFQDKGKPVVVDIVEHLPPDVQAAQYWLNNRRGNSWKSKSEVEHGITGNLAERLRAARERATGE